MPTSNLKPHVTDSELLSDVRREIRLLERTAKDRNLTGQDAQEFLSRIKLAAYPRQK